MPQYIVLGLPTGVPVPAEGVPTQATVYLSTQATESAAAQVAVNALKPNPGDKLWAIDTAALHQYIAAHTYSAALG